MNILKLQDQLKGLPDNALITHVQNPTGQVPTYLALAELQRRKEMRSKYQAQEATPQQSVADDLVAEATQPPPPPPGVAGLPQAQPMMEAMAPPPEMPVQQMAQGGLADLDVGNMFNEQNYAGGGIVAFAEGGDTEKSMNLDNMPSLNLNTGEQNAGGQGGEEYALKNLMSALMNGTGLGKQQPGMEGLLNAFPSKNSNIDYSSLMMPMTPGTNATPDMLRQALGFAGEMYERNPTLDFAQGMYGRNKMAQGGPVRYAEGGDTESSMNLDELPSLNINIIGKPSESNSDQMPGVLGNMGAGLWQGDTGPWNSNPWGRSTPASAPAQPKSYALNLNSGKQEAQYAQGGEVKHYAEGGPSQATLKYQAALADSYLDPRYLVSGAKDLVSNSLFGYRVVRDPETGELIHARDLPTSTDALRKKKKSEVEELLDKAKKVEDERKSAATKKENVADLDPTLAAATFDRSALFKDPNMSELYGMAKPRIPALPEKSKIPPNATQEFNPYANVEKPKSKSNTAEETAKRFQEMMGADPEREALMKKVEALETGSKEQERMAPWLALTKAGFGVMAGKSPFALQNLGEGAQLGISEYVAARDRLDKLNERQLDIRAKLNQVQRSEKAAGVSAGLTKELKEMEELNANARNAATNQVQLKTAAMAAAKKSDYETYLSIAQQDPDNYKTVKNPETGESTKIFDSGKVTQTYRSFSGSSGLDDDKILAMWQQEKLMNKNFTMPFKDYANMIRSGTGGTAQSTTPTKSLNNIFK